MLQPRNPELAFDDVPRHWLGGNPVATHVVNGVNLLFPAGERMFIRSVHHYLDQLDGETQALARGFFGQEGRHAAAHERYFAALEAQGYAVRPWLDGYQRRSLAIERRLSPALRLAVTVALEHFTALLAEEALAGRVLDDAHPAMRRLLQWHAAEEIEHKAVAFDVLKRVAPGWPLRMAGLAVAAATLGGFWLSATRMLLAQDGLSRPELRGALGEFRAAHPVLRRVLGRGVRQYLRPSFHPAQHDNYDLARTWLADAGLA